MAVAFHTHAREVDDTAGMEINIVIIIGHLQHDLEHIYTSHTYHRTPIYSYNWKASPMNRARSPRGTQQSGRAPRRKDAQLWMRAPGKRCRVAIAAAAGRMRIVCIQKHGRVA